MKKIFTIIIFSFLINFPNLVLAQKNSLIVLSWSAPTSVPLIYKGKNLPSHNSYIRVGADFIGEIDEKKENLIFKWFLDDDYNHFSSGKGVDKFNFLAEKNPGEIYNVKVEIFKENKIKRQQILLAASNINIPIISPEIIFYESNAFNAFPKTVSIKPGETIDIKAEPYFFNISNSDLKYEWKIDGKSAKPEEKNNILKITAPAAKLTQPFSAFIRLKISRLISPAQKAEESIVLKVF